MGEVARSNEEYYEYLYNRIEEDHAGNDGEGHLILLLKDMRIEVRLEGDMSYIVYPDGRPYETVPSDSIVDEEPEIEEPVDEEAEDEEPAEDEFVE